MGTITVLYVISFSCFFSLNFSKISFILCDIQVIRGSIIKHIFK
jgi:hypothetical protein